MLNKVILMGRLVADPELKQTTSNKALPFTVAIVFPVIVPFKLKELVVSLLNDL